VKTKVTRDQFEVRENEVVHVPTGARFNAFRGQGHVKSVTWGRAGKKMETGEEYPREEVRYVAAQLLAERTQSFE
jgi:hypothetical protein